MRCIYQIKRIPLERGYRFELRNELSGVIVLTAFGTSFIAPKWLRLRQARLNTTAVLDKMG